MPIGFTLLTARQLFAWACLLLELARLAGDRSTQWLAVGAFQIVIGFLGALGTAGTTFFTSTSNKESCA